VEDDEPREWKIRAGAVPVALVLALAFHTCGTGHFVQRSALTMPLHELGHAVMAWWSGFAAIPSLWKTMIPDTRGVVAPLVVAASNGVIVWRGWTTLRTWLAAVGLGLGALQLLATAATKVSTAQVWITFAGDAGAMILGTALMLLFFVGPESKLRVGGLRYGLLGIGAAALVDTFSTWWSARGDRDVIPFGEIEGVGLSDPSKLRDQYGWTVAQIVDRYVVVGACCFAVLVGVWGWSTWQARRRALAIDVRVDQA
jgi:signal transduction histidine kinase